MSILSSLSSSSPPLIDLFKDRVSSSSSSSSSSSAFSGFGLRRRFVSTSLMCCCCSSKLPLMADSSPLSSFRDDKRVEFRRENAQLFRSRNLLGVRSGEELLAWIRKESRYGRLPGNVASTFEELYENYRNAGHNIILMSNHQTEADPAIIALLLEETNPYIAENMTYVAGDRVVTDPLCKPFSMGRNLLCVYSKRHIYDVPELADLKIRANTRSLKEMALLLRGGSQIIWIAPSGGRDRPDPVTNEWYPAPFDVSSVDNMRRLVEHAGVPGHIYPLSLLCYDIMPPPPQVAKEIGEKRLVSFHGVGMSVAPKINYHDIADHCRIDETIKSAYARTLYDSVNEQYKILKAAVHGKQGFAASTPALSLSQPWSPF